jgi:hypothetical protein
MLTVSRFPRCSASRLALAGAALAAPAAHAQYDSWWKCVDKCCIECPSCVDKCTDDFNSGQSGSGSEYPKFDLTAGYRPGTPTIFYQPPERVQLRVGRYIGERLIPVRGDLATCRFSIVAIEDLKKATAFHSAPWKALPDGEFDETTGMWQVWWSTSLWPDGPYALRAEFVRSDGSVIHGGVNGAFEGDWCQADCNADGELDFFDFLCFQDQFAAGDLAADCDGSGDLDFFDFLCFQNAFAAGCP